MKKNKKLEISGRERQRGRWKEVITETSKQVHDGDMPCQQVKDKDGHVLRSMTQLLRANKASACSVQQEAFMVFFRTAGA